MTVKTRKSELFRHPSVNRSNTMTKSNSINKETAKDKFAALADQIEALFLSGNWKIPFGAARPHRNAATGKRYNGINAFILTHLANEHGFKSREWATFNQIKSKGWSVVKGQKGSPVEFWSTLQDKETKKPVLNENGKEIWFSKYFTVFNLDQCVDADGNPIISQELMVLPDLAEQQQTCYSLAEKMGVKVVHHHESGRAFYVPSKHEVHLPVPEEFHSEVGYINTLLHELGHATHRFVRPDWKKDVFGSIDYAKEEVVAELTAVLASSMFGVEKIPLESHADYIYGWLQASKEDSKTFFKTALKEASKAAFFMWDQLHPEETSVVSVPTDTSESTSDELVSA